MTTAFSSACFLGRLMTLIVFKRIKHDVKLDVRWNSAWTEIRNQSWMSEIKSRPDWFYVSFARRRIFLMKDYWLFFCHFHPVTRSLCCASIRVVQSKSFIGLLVEKRQRKTEIFLFSLEGTRFKSPGRTCKHKDSWSLRRTALGWCRRCVKRRMCRWSHGACC